MKPQFSPGENIAMKVPSKEFRDTVSFYRDILGFEEADVSTPGDIESATFKFGEKVILP